MIIFSSVQSDAPSPRERNILLLFNLFLFCLLSAGLVVYIDSAVPFNMDEFLAHSFIGRFFFPFTEANIFRENISYYDLKPSGIWSWIPLLPLRSYHYVGSAPALYYLPLYLVFPEPFSVRLLGICMIGLQAMIAGRLFGYRWWWVFTLLIFFMPYTFQHLVDFGQLSFQTTSVFIFFYLLREWRREITTGPSSDWYAALAGLLLAFCLWIRLSYIFVLVPLVLAAAVAGFGFFLKRSTFERTTRDALVFLLFLGVPAHILLTARGINGQPYYSLLFAFGGKLDLGLVHRMVVHTQILLTEHLFNLISTAKVVKYVVANQTFWLSLCFWFATAALIVWGVIAAPAPWIQARRVLGYLGLSAITALLTGIVPSSWAMHHVILMVPFLVCAFLSSWCHIRQRRLAQVILIAMLSINIFLYGLLPVMPQANTCDFENMPKLNAYLNDHFSDSDMLIIYDWGMYYPKILYGESTQHVVWGDLRIERKKALQMARQRGLRPLFLGREALLQEFPDEYKCEGEIVPLPFETGQWRLMKLKDDCPIRSYDGGVVIH